ncbi:MAG: alpha/beta fold hydrolase [Planctomycetales bacterium]
MPSLLTNGPEAGPTVVLAHGAGAAMDTDFMNFFAEGFAERDARVVRFEFPYMVKRRETGGKRPPDREPILRRTWLEIIESLGAENLIIGGKSMGGRMASLVADEAKVAGLLCLGYPFHPSGKPDRLRTEHLRTIETPTLILQGERDPMGNRTEVAGYDLSSSVQVHWMADGDHGFKPRKKSGLTVEDNWREGVRVAADFVHGLN